MKLIIFITLYIAANAQNPSTSNSNLITNLASSKPTGESTTTAANSLAKTTTVVVASSTTTTSSTTIPNLITSTTLAQQDAKSPQSHSSSNLPKPSRPWNCKNFRFSSLPFACCSHQPKFQLSNDTRNKCKSECEKMSIGSHHCCMTECKYRESGIYVSKQFKANAITTAYVSEIANESEKSEWMNATKASIDKCVYNQETKATTILLKSVNNLTTIEETSTTGTNERTREEHVYCNIPIYVFFIVSCVKIQNFINCPRMTNDYACDEWKSFLTKCDDELEMQI